MRIVNILKKFGKFLLPYNILQDKSANNPRENVSIIESRLQNNKAELQKLETERDVMQKEYNHPYASVDRHILKARIDELDKRIKKHTEIVENVQLSIQLENERFPKTTKPKTTKPRPIIPETGTASIKEPTHTHITHEKRNKQLAEYVQNIQNDRTVEMEQTGLTITRTSYGKAVVAADTLGWNATAVKEDTMARIAHTLDLRKKELKEETEHLEELLAAGTNPAAIQASSKRKNRLSTIVENLKGIIQREQERQHMFAAKTR